jgi:hypothetical protein
MARDKEQELTSSSSSDREAPAQVYEPAGAAYPVPAIAGRSVIKALVPASRPTTLFWTGLFMVLAGLVLVLCPLLVGAALAVAQGVQGPSQMALGAVGLSACFTVVLLLPGVALMVAGRAR